MAKRELRIEVDCGRERCKMCHALSKGGIENEDRCWLFSRPGAQAWLDSNAKGRPLRCQQCLDAEVAGVPTGGDGSVVWGEPVEVRFGGKVMP
jgi:hypothetical protein